MGENMFPAYDFNGVFSVGLASAGEENLTTADKITILEYVAVDGTLMRPASAAWALAIPPTGCSADVAFMYRECAAFLVATKSYDENNATVIDRATVGDQKELVADYKGSTRRAGHAALLCVAPLINYWAMNHHTGQGRMVGFALKAFKLSNSWLGPNYC